MTLIKSPCDDATRSSSQLQPLALYHWTTMIHFTPYFSHELVMKRGLGPARLADVATPTNDKDRLPKAHGGPLFHSCTTHTHTHTHHPAARASVILARTTAFALRPRCWPEYSIGIDKLVGPYGQNHRLSAIIDDITRYARQSRIDHPSLCFEYLFLIHTLWYPATATSELTLRNAYSSTSRHSSCD